MSRRKSTHGLGTCVLLVASMAIADEAKEPQRADEEPKIVLRWTTASEVDNYGFFVLRSETEEGPFMVLNKTPIPGAANSEVPKDYVYEDVEVIPGKTYYYYIESVSISGRKEKFSPTLHKTCCEKPAKEKEPAKAPVTPPSK